MVSGLAPFCIFIVICTAFQGINGKRGCKNAIPNKTCKLKIAANPAFCETVGGQENCKKKCGLCEPRGIVAKLVKEIDALKIVLDKLYTTVDQQRQEINNILATGKEQNKTISALNQALTDVEEKQNTRVFFSAGLTSSPKLTVLVGKTLVFNKVYDSVGGGYNSTTGEFRCPVSGHYKFTLHVMAQVNMPVYFGISLNGAKIVQVVASDNVFYDTTSNTVIVELQQNDVVKVYASSTSYVYGAGYTTFTGLLLSSI